MILGFKRKFNDGTLTHFMGKILAGTDLCGEKYSSFTPKIHTLRTGNRWRVGTPIQMAYGVRTKEYYQFNEGIKELEECKGVQDVFISSHRASLQIIIDGKLIKPPVIDDLIKNDGLTKPQFVDWFFPKDSKQWYGQIIHWTDYKY